MKSPAVMTSRELVSIRITSIILLWLIGVSAISAGFSFMVEPSGKDVGISTDYLKYAPFSDYFFPGLILFTVVGLFGIFTAMITMVKWKPYFYWIATYGTMLTGWIFVQILMVRDFNAMHLFCLLAGLLLIIFSKILHEST